MTDISEELLERMLQSQAWIEPRADFTERVLARMPAVKPAPARLHWSERAVAWVPVLVIVAMISRHIKFLTALLVDGMHEIGFRIGSVLGLPEFAAYPIMVLGIIAPILAAAVASCALTGRCHLTRAMTR